MAKIEVTRREFHNSWKAHKSLWQSTQPQSTQPQSTQPQSTQPQSNATLTCLFYAIECGLKAVILKQEGREFSGPKESEFGHDINKMLNLLRVRKSLLIDDDYQLSELKNPGRPRNASKEQINQVFRYGMMFKSNEKKQALTEKLTSIVSARPETQFLGTGYAVHGCTAISTC